MADTRLRALVAVLVGMLGALVGVAGLGHVYLRQWRRALAWFAAVVGATFVLFAVFEDPANATDPESWSDSVLVPVFVLLSLSIFDAYHVARGRRGGGDDEDAHRCPNCRRETDPEYAFCTWCAEPLDGGDDGEGGAAPFGPRGADSEDR